MLDSPVCSITDQLDGLEVCFSWWFHCPNLTLWIKDHNVVIKCMTYKFNDIMLNSINYLHVSDIQT